MRQFLIQSFQRRGFPALLLSSSSCPFRHASAFRRKIGSSHDETSNLLCSNFKEALTFFSPSFHSSWSVGRLMWVGIFPFVKSSAYSVTIFRPIDAALKRTARKRSGKSRAIVWKTKQKKKDAGRAGLYFTPSDENGRTYFRHDENVDAHVAICFPGHRSHRLALKLPHLSTPFPQPKVGLG